MKLEKDRPSIPTTTFSTEHVISLMDIYLREWEHRDTLLWSQVFKLFYANLIIIVLPNIAGFLDIELPMINTKAFPILGIVVSIIFLYVALGYAVRLRACSLTYELIMHMLNSKEHERISIKDRDKLPGAWWFSPPLATVLITAMFVSLIALSTIMLIIM